MFIRIVSLLLLASLLGCAGSGSRAPVEDRHGRSSPSTMQYVVQRGDTLYSIAFRYGLDYRKVAQVNRIASPYVIYPGQTIYLWTVASTPAYVAPPVETPPPVTPPNTSAVTAAPGASPVIVTAVPGMAGVSAAKPTLPRPVYQADSPAVAPAGTTTTPSVPVTTPSVAAGAPPAGVKSVPTPVPVVPAPVSTPKPAPAPTPAPPPAAPRGKVTGWLWPARGKVSRGYSSSVHKGIDISGNRGDPIYAVADGVVVYAGTGIVGFGELVILKHNDIYISAYGHNDRLLVRENDVVRAGQTIAEKGSSGTDTVKLHFEIRKEGKPVDPLRLLPRR